MKPRDPNDALLRRLSAVKQSSSPSASPIGAELLSFFNQSVQKRHTKLSRVAEVWLQLVPEQFNDHCSLDAFSRGALSVSVDSSAHLYELKQLLLSGLEQQLMLACKSAGLRKIMLKLGPAPRQ